MAISRPHAVLTVDGRKLTAAEAGLVDVEVRLSVGGAHDSVRLRLWPGSKIAGAAVGARIEVDLGEVGDEVRVLTGEVVAARMTPMAVELEGLAATVALSRSRTVQSFVGVSVADVVRALAGEVTVDAVQADLTLEAYAVDDRRPAWAHLRRLAALVGAELGASAEGGLRFVPPQTGPGEVTLRAGAELLGWRVGSQAAPTPPVVKAHGSASEQGSARWHWVRRDPGDGEPVRVVGGFHTRDAADGLATALSAGARRGGVGGGGVGGGDPTLRAGDAIAFEGVAGLSAGRAVEVVHRLDGRGFCTELWVEGADGGASGLLAAVGL